MKTYGYECDKCKKSVLSEAYRTPDGWEECNIKVGGIGYSSSYKFSKDLLLCPDCQAKLGYTVEKPTPAQQISIQDSLYEAFSEIIAEQMQQIQQ